MPLGRGALDIDGTPTKTAEAVDLEGRKQLARLIRALAAGSISTDHFDTQAAVLARGAHASDHAMAEIYDAVSALYGDVVSYRLRGRHRLDRQTRRQLARVVLFLHTTESIGTEQSWSSEPIAASRPLVNIGLPVLIATMLAGASMSSNSPIVLLICVACAASFAAIALQTAHRNSRVNAARHDPRSALWPFPTIEALERARQGRVFFGGCPLPNDRSS